MIISYLATIILLISARSYATVTHFQLRGEAESEITASRSSHRTLSTPAYRDSCNDFNTGVYPTVPFSASAYDACSFYHELSEEKFGTCGVDAPLDGQPNNDNICHARGGDCHVAFTEPGEWLEYTFNVDKSSVSRPVYDIVVRVASLLPKTFSIEVDNGGNTIRKQFTAPGKGYFEFEDIIWDHVSISDTGPERIFVDFLDGGINFCSITVEETSYLFLDSKELTIPFTANAQNYLTFIDKSQERWGNCGPGPVDSQPTSDEVCQQRGSYCNIGFTEPGEEVTYWVKNDNDFSTTKDVTVRLASYRRNRRVRIEIEGQEDSKIFKTLGRGYQNYDDYEWKGVNFPPGNSRLIVKFLDRGINMCSVSVE